MLEPAVAPEPLPGFWATIRDAVRGDSHRDYTELPIGRAVVLLSVPMVLEMLMESVFAVADVFFVGRLGADAVATVGITESLMTMIFLLFAPQLVSAFSSDPAVIPYGVECLRIVAAGFLFYGYGMVLSMSFNGAGDTRTPTLINLFCLWLFEIPLAWVLAHPLGFGPTGVFIAVAVAFSVLALVSAWLFKRGSWKTRRV
jgi:Na+-driven multidrug efflux pump